MEPSGASDKRVSVLERAVLCRFRKLESPQPTEDSLCYQSFPQLSDRGCSLGVDARRSQAHCQSGRGLPALRDADATAEPLPTFRALPSSGAPNWSLLQPTRLLVWSRAVSPERPAHALRKDVGNGKNGLPHLLQDADANTKTSTAFETASYLNSRPGPRAKYFAPKS